jgi:hypothetical protein
MHCPLQSVEPMGQVKVQLLATHAEPLMHCRPHWPQLARLVCRSVHWPLQALWPMGQPQAPMLQVVPPAQTLPQRPQLVWFTAGLMHCPLQVI